MEQRVAFAGSVAEFPEHGHSFGQDVGCCLWLLHLAEGFGEVAAHECFPAPVAEVAEDGAGLLEEGSGVVESAAAQADQAQRVERDGFAESVAEVLPDDQRAAVPEDASTDLALG